MSLWQALFLGFLQGATELFPVSSLGHTVLLPRLLGWNLNQSDPSFVPFVVLLHLGTATALIVIFRREWLAIVAGVFRAIYRGRPGEGPNQRPAMLPFLGPPPTRLVAATIVGATQALALFPGISRSGSTVTAGLVAGLRHYSAARLSFLLATPVILAAGVLEVPALFTAGSPLGVYFAGAVVAGITAYISARFLLRYFRSGRLDPFAIYCVALGLIGLYAARRPAPHKENRMITSQAPLPLS